ncbi:hypothetical protein MASR2M78_08080 [Treponema sp.]
MKYFGKKSLSSVMSGVLRIVWYPLFACMILAPLIGIAIVFFSTPYGEKIGALILQGDQATCAMNAADAKQWDFFKNLPVAIKSLIVPYFGTIVVLFFLIINKAKLLFTNFKNDVVFHKSNVMVISAISKLVIALSILSFSFSSFLIGIVLLLLCEIIKNGATLQEELDLTV